ncbi:dTDP-4-dehydrorhamnose reductase [Paenibacillus sp. V4I9]|uniref:dTDP-4-dehydrorhamnose reductase n=1 Tax=Paenibacillus sp. V4I9 TaxID=3042308 RepID=UPI0027815FB8|nr:dTDP-4-dehydrorhamnose reductase [Paenibacillus sp. V4I9]MDQ0890865.1 dTDP-4-dehydrorhamnose reductase [Paenibacillus sp. V4I9]
MRVLITGGNGQVGSEVVDLFQPHYDVHSFSRDAMNVTNSAQVNEIVAKIQPDVIIHCAAYTAVDQAEQEQERAYEINALGTRNVAIAAQQLSAKLVYISTDYVFDGKKEEPYVEEDTPSPLGVYGKSKLAGEMYVSTLCDKYFVVRTSWVYGRYGDNFVKKLLKQSRKQKQFHVVEDQIGSPTSALELARFLFKLVGTKKYGYYHAANQGACSWFEFAKAIVKCRQLEHVMVLPCVTEVAIGRAQRPSYSVLDSQKAREFGWDLLGNWQDSLAHFLQHYQEQDDVNEG